MGEQIVEKLESFVRDLIVLIVNICTNVCMEILKFYIFLLILFYFTLWSFRVLDQLSFATPIPAKLAAKNYFRTEYDMEQNSVSTRPVLSETFLRIGAPDEQLIKHRASLLEQLEIEAEFEENIKQQTVCENSFSKSEVHNTAITVRNSNEVVPLKDLFISQKEYEQNETSQPSQTTKTSLGKKSKPANNNFENERQANSTLIEQPESNDDAAQTTLAEQEATASHNAEQIKHENSHRT